MSKPGMRRVFKGKVYFICSVCSQPWWGALLVCLCPAVEKCPGYSVVLFSAWMFFDSCSGSKQWCEEGGVEQRCCQNLGQ